jgi:hypothetical protein
MMEMVKKDPMVARGLLTRLFYKIFYPKFSRRSIYAQFRQIIFSKENYSGSLLQFSVAPLNSRTRYAIQKCALPKEFAPFSKETSSRIFLERLKKINPLKLYINRCLLQNRAFLQGFKEWLPSLNERLQLHFVSSSVEGKADLSYFSNFLGLLIRKPVDFLFLNFSLKNSEIIKLAEWVPHNVWGDYKILCFSEQALVEQTNQTLEVLVEALRREHSLFILLLKINNRPDLAVWIQNLMALTQDNQQVRVQLLEDRNLW